MPTHELQLISVFDLDRTLTRKPTWSHFLIFAARRHAPWRLALAPCALLMMLSYKLGLISRARLKAMMQFLMLGSRVGPQRLQDLTTAFSDLQLRTNMRDGCLDLLRADRASGRRIVIATAAFDFYADGIARRLGISDVVATKGIRRDGMLKSGVDGQNCYGTAKRDMLEAYLLAQDLDPARDHIRFYSDDASDLPTFNWADEPVAISPSKRLRRHAERNGWPIFDWMQETGRAPTAVANEASAQRPVAA